MADEPSMPVIVERIKNVQDDVTDIKRDMATKTDQAHIDDRIRDLTGALEKERAERVAAVDAEKKERIAADKEEAEARKAVAARLQVVEDRMEARKYATMSSVALSVLAAVLGVFAAFGKAIFGG